MTWPVTWTSGSPEETRTLAARVAALCRPGDVVLLVGDLGAGKTVFAQGFAAALGVPGPVTSPTFALVRQYRCGEGSPVGLLIHADVYRTGSLDEVVDLALAELVEEDAVALVEWGELAAPAFGDERARDHPGRPGPRGDARTSAPSPWSAAAVGPSDRTQQRCWRGGHGSDAVSGGRASMAAAMARTGADGHGGDRDGHRDRRGRRPDGDRVQAELTLTGRRRHVETLTPALEHLLEQLGLVPGDLGIVAVDIGPGLFTGLRVGLAAAKGLAQSLDLGVMGATSLDILTAGAAAAGSAAWCSPASTPDGARSSPRRARGRPGRTAAGRP